MYLLNLFDVSIKETIANIVKVWIVNFDNALSC